jgi:hypothetical protein
METEGWQGCPSTYRDPAPAAGTTITTAARSQVRRAALGDRPVCRLYCRLKYATSL